MSFKYHLTNEMLLLAATYYFYYELVMFWTLFSHQFHLKQP